MDLCHFLCYNSGGYFDYGGDLPVKIKKYHLMVVWLLVLVLTGCAVMPAEPVPEQTTPVQPVPQIQEPKLTEPVQPVSLAAEPEFEKANGNMVFYIGEKPVYAGGYVADIITAGGQTSYDLDEILEPLHCSGEIRVQMNTPENSAEDREPLAYFVAMNPTDQPLPASKCLIYSVTVNYENGISFGRSKAGEPFVSGVSRMEEILDTYGEPTRQNITANMTEVAYYGPFDCAYFLFKDGIVQQISTYYSGNVFGELAESFEGKLPDSYYGYDCYILMDQYLDVDAYLQEPQETAAVVEELPMQIMLNGENIQLGGRSKELPAPFGEYFDGLRVPLDAGYYVRIGIKNEEEFYLINLGQYSEAAGNARVKGVITRSCTYHNWGQDNSGYFHFDYQGITQDSTIEEVLEKFGRPQELVCASNSRVCFAWLHYEDAKGNTLRIQVDPIADQVVELRICKYFQGERAY